jgi:Holliday junction resolvasome RuvABC endonuclease subunit
MMNKKITKMLSLDLATKKSGLAYWEDGIYKESYVIDFEKIKEIEERTISMAKKLIDALNYYKPSIVYSEDSFKGRNPKTMKYLCRLHGVVMGWCLDNNAEYQFIMPSGWRKYIPDFPNGRGVSREEQKNFSVKYVTQKYGFIPKTDDESDAILVGEGMIRKYGK